MPEVQPLFLALPESLPQSCDEVRARRTGPVCEALRLSLSRLGASDGEMLAGLRAALAALPSPESRPDSAPSNKPLADRDAHDRYCRIERVEDERSPVVHVHSVLRAYEELIEDMLEGGTTLSARQWYQLRAAFDTMLLFLNGDFAAEPAPEEAQVASTLWRAGQRPDPLARWIRGHHVFLVLIQGVITTVNCFVSAYAARELKLSAEMLDTTTRIFDGCSASLHFAGDFLPGEYEKTVRPSMMPPNVPPGMSGVLARDHEHLMHLLRGQQPVFTNLDPSLSEHHRQFVSAFGNTYEAHKVVCSRFVGDERPSLLNRDGEADAAVGVLDKVKTSRLRSLHEF
jgi:hypothetical protein